MDGTKIRISREKKASSLAFFPRRSIHGAAEERLSRVQSQFYSRLPRRSIIYRRNTAAPWRRAGRSLRPRRLAKFEYRGIRIVINHRCAERTANSALHRRRNQIGRRFERPERACKTTGSRRVQRPLADFAEPPQSKRCNLLRRNSAVFCARSVSTSVRSRRRCPADTFGATFR